ncbi:MAG: hypothetical protein EOP38_05200 [Rubrivivax sp.]|nr:MAG: hypothetical protein EOP38_05200 [Rubrivivax sp.]
MMRNGNAGMDDSDDAIRQLAGNCYLALRTRDARHLAQVPDAVTLVRSGLAGMYANLSVHLGLETDRSTLIRGMQLAAVNASRWHALSGMLAPLRREGFEPVLFKGGVLHARWPLLRELRAMADYDLIVHQDQAEALRVALGTRGFISSQAGSALSQRLSKGWMLCRGSGHAYENIDIHARVTEPPVCSSLTKSILASNERVDGIRVPDIEDSVCMIALHIVRSGMHRPLREYIDLLWYVDEMDDKRWQALVARARLHDLIPALFLSLRQAVFCLALDTLAPMRADVLHGRVGGLGQEIGALRMRAIDWLAPRDYPLHPIAARNRPVFRRSLILGAGTSCMWRVATAFLLYGASRLCDHFVRADGHATGPATSASAQANTPMATLP